MLEMKEVSYSYKNKKVSQVTVLEDVSFQFETGKTYALFGSSGSGKTTCLMLLGGLEQPDCGEILIDGKNIQEIGYNKLRRTRISYVFQDYQLFPYMTAIENLMAAADISGEKKKVSERKKYCMELLEFMGITPDEMNRVVTKLSGGQQQRIAIARALVNNPDYILADEPTGNLDKKNTRMIMELFTKIAHEKNKCIIIVTHSSYVLNSCDMHYQIEKGEPDEDRKTDMD